MAEQASQTTTIAASPERVWAIAADFERYPEWARDVKDVVVRSRDGEGRPIAMVGITKDLTEQRRIDEDRVKTQKLESIGVLAGGLVLQYGLGFPAGTRPDSLDPALIVTPPPGLEAGYVPIAIRQAAAE
jgi:hypothetical protein